MQSGSSGGDGEIIGGINLTPLVDITLVLLIIFIVTAKLIVAPAVPLELPRAARTDEIQVIFSIAVPRQGPTLVNRVAVDGDAELLARIQAAVGRDAEVRAVIDADGAVPHRQIIHLLDLLRQGGMERIAFGALPPEPGPPPGEGEPGRREGQGR
jgi:biopolymer transport protein ExbD